MTRQRLSAGPVLPASADASPECAAPATEPLARSLGLGRRTLPAAGRLRSLGEVADYLGVSIRTVRRLIVRGELRAHRVGRSLRIQDAELAAYVAASMEQ
ncbi:helix-turn-helix domain-containing protein [Neoroseomonas soli]|uniref:Excisionase family DNA-binding protein n=1 Tax=Neoroseomonas soli TaxID=1081025 RepID=A0A9X9X357_9PROT|nr:helix-turn-helix domain-containing protein [Neoroseomonas soli]MBR0673836.1 excisionase family DNA-binding protein [Neoroseomonas soli]